MPKIRTAYQHRAASPVGGKFLELRDQYRPRGFEVSWLDGRYLIRRAGRALHECGTLGEARDWLKLSA